MDLPSFVEFAKFVVVPAKEQAELKAIVDSTRTDIVGKPEASAPS
jgi:hypothetical protein